MHGGGAAAEDRPLFAEVTAELGLPSAHQPWPAGTYALHEVKGGGVGLFDYDNDGDLDILELRFPPPGHLGAEAPNRLFQQQADGTFLHVTASGLEDPGNGRAAAIGDVDNDGDADVYIANFGEDAFCVNNGDGTFTDATREAGFSGDRWSTSAAFVDYDRDGDLDLYVVHYVEFDSEVKVYALDGTPDYAHPSLFESTPDSLYRNNGDGTFTDVTRAVGINGPRSGLGVVCADFTGDGWVDIYVGNDTQANQLWVSGKDGSFTDEAHERGCALNAYGQPEASMGLTVGDADGNGRSDLFLAHYRGETNTLYVATAEGTWVDGSDASGLAGADLPFTSFGCGFFDFDNDGDPDVAVVNGRVVRGPIMAGAALGPFWSRYGETNLLYRNNGQGRFSEVTREAGAFGDTVRVSRGLAFGDLDNDGDVDLVESNLGGGVSVYRNDAPAPGTHWLVVRAITGNRDALGAEIRLRTGGRTHLGLVLATYSYASSNDPRVHFGLGSIDSVDAIDVRWPNGKSERFGVPGVDRLVTLREGSGKAIFPRGGD